MILLEQGKLLLDDPVGNYIPEYNTTTVAKDELPIRWFPPIEKSPSEICLPIRRIGYGWGCTWSMEKSRNYRLVFCPLQSYFDGKAIARLPQKHSSRKVCVRLQYGYFGALIEVVATTPWWVFTTRLRSFRDERHLFLFATKINRPPRHSLLPNGKRP